jgi:hypothetical protein
MKAGPAKIIFGGTWGGKHLANQEAIMEPVSVLSVELYYNIIINEKKYP